MGDSTCAECGETFAYGYDGDDPFTHFSVSPHNQPDEQFAVSVCADCASDVVETLRGWTEMEQ